ncbi:MAG: aldo/keto reductase [Micavibrio aeruginosavorus]|uniref:Aldo/keto reductase n=1 Tax=Micavibrio aeruginosavorus TaxID=349221 RepID=A0A2W5N4A7_9BACT|nr:MAG: aldo/keto reductase [Micavibrio aeruginosavorus]
MQYSKLGSSGLKVSRVCLGTMTWGKQNNEAEGHEQMDYAVDQGINFFDTAEMYAVPPSADTYGKTEEIIGTWFKKTGKRKDIILASKLAGPSFDYVRGGNRVDGKNIREAVEGSLKRLQTDYMDLYQLHWPNRPFPHFGRNNAGEIDFTKANAARETENFLDVLQTLDECIKAGKIRYIGLSDDSAWGVSKYIELAQLHNLPRMTSIQNEFSLLKRSDDPYLAEVCVMEEVAYLPWSPLAAGSISGKYLNGARPEGTRWAIDPRPPFRDTPEANAAVVAYMDIAKKHGMDVCQMALKFCDMQSFVTSTIIGATKMEQLKSNIAAFDIELSDDVMKDIDKVYRQYPIPY